MRNLIAFFRRFKIFLIFSAFQIIALSFYFSQRGYPRNAFLSSTSTFTGSILSVQKTVTNYLSLADENQKLSNSLGTLLNNNEAFYLIPDTSSFLSLDTLQHQRYALDPIHVISGGTKQLNNYITIDAGANEGAVEGMGVVGPKGVLGFITDVGTRFSLVKSILCKDNNINAMIAKNGAHGLLKWDGHDPTLVQLNEITNDTDIQKGDTIVTRGSGSSFARGMPIGIVESVSSNDGAVYLNIEVKLSENMNQVYHAFLIKDLFKEEFDQNKALIKKYNAK